MVKMDGMIAPSVLEFHLFNNMFIFFYVGGMKKNTYVSFAEGPSD